MSIQDDCILWNKLGSDAELATSEIGVALSWDGTKTYKSCKFDDGIFSDTDANRVKGADTNFNPDEFMVESWLKTDWSCTDGVASDSGQHIFWSWIYDGSNRIHASMGASDFNLNIRVGGVNNYQAWTTNITFSSSTLVHLLWVYKRGTIGATSDTKRLYVDGVDVGSTTSVPSSQGNSGGTLYFAGDSYGRHLDGTQDNVKIYDTVTEQNITDILANRNTEGWPSTTSRNARMII